MIYMMMIGQKLRRLNVTNASHLVYLFRVAPASWPCQSNELHELFVLPRMSSKGMSSMSLIECPGRSKYCETGVELVSW